MGHLRMELHAVDAPVAVLQGGNGDLGGRGGGHETFGHRLDRVEMAHPDVEGRRHLVEQRRPTPGRGVQRRPSVFAPAGVGHGAAELLGDQLGPVADAEHRHPRLVEIRVQQRRPLDVNRLRATRENGPRRLAGHHLRRGDGVGHDLGVDVRLSDPPGDQLGVLGPEIDDQYGVEGGRRPSRGSSGDLALHRHRTSDPCRPAGTAAGTCPRSAARGRPSPRPSGTP